MVSRLDRLFILIDTGSNESIRLAAAKQLGEVQKVQPNDLNYLLCRVKEYSSKSVWETRVAAGHAIRCILEQVDPWPKAEDDNLKGGSSQLQAEQLLEQNVDTSKIFQQFNLQQVLAKCPILLSMNAAAEIFDTSENNDATSSKQTSSRGRGRKSSSTSSSRGTFRGRSPRKDEREQLMRQRKLINKELGLGMVDSLNIGVKSTDIVSNDDLLEACEVDASTTSQPSQTTKDAKVIFKQCICNYERLIELLIKGQYINKSYENGGDNLLDPDTSWPLQKLVNEYLDDLLNPLWEVRHGAAIALREIIRLQGKSAGKISGLTKRANSILNQVWLVDTALRVCCVLALDKFGDFLFDQVVAPVRENAGQLLGCCVSHMPEKDASFTIDTLLKMLEFNNWEARHGGILGLKYSLNVINKSFVRQMLKLCFDSVFKCLNDQVDDVSAEAAAALVSVKDLLLETVPDRTPQLIKFLWEHITDLDEITTSTSNIVLLLASLITFSSTDLDSAELIKSIPKLWSLLNHSSTSVRISVLKALVTLFKSQKTSCSYWMPQDLMTTALMLVFQRAVLENMDEVSQYIEATWIELVRIDNDSSLAQEERLNLLKSTSQQLNHWLCLTMQPSNVPIDRESNLWLNISPDGTVSATKPDGDVFIGSCTFDAESVEQHKSQVTKCRLMGARLLGRLYAELVVDSNQSQSASETLKYLTDMFNYYLKSKSAIQRSVSGWVLEAWAHQLGTLLHGSGSDFTNFMTDALKSQIISALRETSIYYDELAPTLTRLQQDAREYVAALNSSNVKLNLPNAPDKRIIYNMSQLVYICQLDLESELEKAYAKRPAKDASARNPSHNILSSDLYKSLASKRTSMRKCLESANSRQKTMSITVAGSLSCALISWYILPKDVELVSSSLLKSIEFESEQVHQETSSYYLVKLFDMICGNSENYDRLIDSLLKKLIELLSYRLTDVKSEAQEDKNRIVTLSNLQRRAEQNKGTLRRRSSIVHQSTLKRSHSSTTASTELTDNSQEDQSQLELVDSKADGSSLALKKLTAHFAIDLPNKLPKLWSRITSDISSLVETLIKSQSNQSKELEDDLLLLETIAENLSSGLRSHLLDLCPTLVKLLVHHDPIIRHQSAQCIGIICRMMFEDTIDLIKQSILPLLDRDNVAARCGAIEATALIIEQLQLDLVPYINIFVVHVLRRMSDQNEQVRQMATHCFGKLLSLMPLNLGKTSTTSDIDADEKQEPMKIKEEKESKTGSGVVDEQDFIEQLLNPKKLKNSSIPFEFNAQLRTYQQEGLNWLDFLNRFNLHGILCDEMGLGKTLMTIIIVALDHWRANHSKSTITADQAKCTPSLIVCPSTLTNHWQYEIRKFLPNQDCVLKSVLYGGSLNDRLQARSDILKHLSGTGDCDPRYNLVIASYDVIRNDIEFFKDINWNYCVLDEGHIIKNAKTKLSKAIRLLNAKHRLILSGTPIQNNVTELWSLFDFLMPGFLGSERQFQSRFARPILQSREPKCSNREQEAGALAMESLHRQVLPFIMRRLKEDVLQDLPPKIIQDYYCELSPLQHKLYEDFTRSRLCKTVTKSSVLEIGSDELEPNAKSNSKSHVFQALQYLKSVCNHPKLVLSPKHSQYKEISQCLEREKNSLDDINNSSKLKALKQLLIDCGISGVSTNGQAVGDELSAGSQQQQTIIESSVVKQHRALIFCQLRSMADIVENDLLKVHLPGITYLRLDGSVHPNARQSIVNRFNDDPSIDVLLLTTQIGGLGLNLTGADTVIFVEHDWNPTKDLQAMDRAHRIGQKKVVNVYRLITKETLEEKIMGLQKFKTMVSNTVINQDNTCLGSMNVDQLFDLFESPAVGESNESGKRTKSFTSPSATASVTASGAKSSFIDLLPELWDQQQYETEYNLDNFVSSIKD